MSTSFSSYNFKLNGPQYLKDNITIGYVVKNLLKTDNYATMQSKAIASAAYSGADVTISANGNDCQTVINQKSGLDPSGTALVTDDISVAYCSGTEVILVVDAQDRIITNETGDTIDILTATHYSRETTTV